MEESVLALNFETVDQMVQVHDYEGVSLSSRDANSKQAASEASSIFQNHYPEFLVSLPPFSPFSPLPHRLTHARSTANFSSTCRR